jgi:hypothetical protein
MISWTSVCLISRILSPSGLEDIPAFPADSAPIMLWDGCMTIRQTILSVFEQVAKERDTKFRDALDDDMILLDSGLDSMTFALSSPSLRAGRLLGSISEVVDALSMS